LGGEDNRSAAFWLAALFQKLLRDVVPAMRSAMDWLRAVTKFVSSADLAVQWVNPLGFPVLHAYQRTPTNSVEIHYGGKKLQLQLKDHASEESRTAPVNGTAAANAIAPNFIHSMDAAHLMLVANACADQGIQSLAVIHDSFGTHAANTDKLGTILRETFVDLYRGDPLGQLRNAVLEQLKNHPELAVQIPPVPAQGCFDIDEVLGSTYMFA
jgi:DNA-directed RNA polymerase